MSSIYNPHDRKPGRTSRSAKFGRAPRACKTNVFEIKDEAYEYIISRGFSRAAKEEQKRSKRSEEE